MSCHGGEPAEAWVETWRTARKRHICTACRETIEPGHRYVDNRAIFDSRVSRMKRCARCQAIFDHLCDIDRGDGIAGNLDCGHSYEDIHGAPPPEHIAALAFALPGETPPAPTKSDERADAVP